MFSESWYTSHFSLRLTGPPRNNSVTCTASHLAIDNIEIFRVFVNNNRQCSKQRCFCQSDGGLSAMLGVEV